MGVHLPFAAAMSYSDRDSMKNVWVTAVEPLNNINHWKCMHWAETVTLRAFCCLLPPLLRFFTRVRTI